VPGHEFTDPRRPGLATGTPARADPRESFADDPLRMLQAAGSSQLGVTPDRRGRRDDRFRRSRPDHRRAVQVELTSHARRIRRRLELLVDTGLTDDPAQRRCG
jgi:hypothetical protein